jgi:hypothetical protein
MATANGNAPAVLSPDNINPKLLRAEYAVRGYIAQKAEEYRQRVAAGETDLPFAKVTSCRVAPALGFVTRRCSLCAFTCLFSKCR